MHLTVTTIPGKNETLFAQRAIFDSLSDVMLATHRRFAASKSSGLLF